MAALQGKIVLKIGMQYGKLQGRRNIGRTGGGENTLRAIQTYTKQKKSLPMIMPVTRRGAGGLVSHEKNFYFPGKM